MEGIGIKKKITMLALILVAALSLMMGKLTAKAAETEVTPIRVGEQVSGTLVDNRDSNWYSFNSSERGYYTVDFSPATPVSSSYWCVSLYDINYNQIKKYDLTKGFTSLKISNYIGSNYYVEVAAGIAYGAGGVPYNLKVNFYADPLWENDNNDSEAAATDIVLNSDMKGILDHSAGHSDVDVYKLTIPAQKGCFNISLKHADISDVYFYNLELYTANGEIIYDKKEKAVNVDTLSFKPGSVLYIKISEPSGSAARFEPYILRVDYTYNEFYEQENNNNQSEATPIALGGEYTGVLDGRSNETDYYSFTLLQDSKVSVEFGPKDIANTGYWNVNVIDSAGSSTNWGSTNSRTTQNINLKKGTYYIHISNNTFSRWCGYIVKVTASNLPKISTPKIKKATIKNSSTYGFIKSIKLNKAVSGDVDYEVRVSAKKNMKKPILVTTADAKKTLKSFGSSMMKKKSVYYIQVRPCVTDCFGNNIYVGAKSNVYKAKGKK